MCRCNNKPGNHEYVWSYRNLKQEQVQIRFNLVVAIAIAQIVFLSGIDASETKVRHSNAVFFFIYYFSCYLRLLSVVYVKTSLRAFHLHIHYHSNQTRFHSKSFVLRISLKRRQKATWKGLINFAETFGTLYAQY